MDDLEVSRNRILSDPLVRRLIERLPLSGAGPVFLVGGALRDGWLGRPIRDLDFAVSGDARTYARLLADTLGARFVLLDEQWGVARLVWEVPEITPEPVSLDFATLQGKDIDEDLSRRDFTCNAMAISLGREPGLGVAGMWEDPEGGIRDLRGRRIRMVRPTCFRADPVRMLRAFRFACHLGFSLEEETVRRVGADKALLLSSAAERIGDEFYRFLGGTGTFPYLQEMDRCGILSVLFPELDRLRGLVQGKHHHLDGWSHTLEAYRLLESGIESGFPGLDRWQGKVQSWIREKDRTAALLKVAALLHDIGKPATLTVDPEGGVHFYGHAARGSEVAQALLQRIRSSRLDQERVRNWVRYHLGPLNLLAVRQRGLPAERAMVRFLRKAGPDATGLLVLALCDLQASRGQGDAPNAKASLSAFIDSLFALATRMEEACGSGTTPLVSGHDLMLSFDLKPGPLIGRLLRRVEEDRALGRIQSREEALALVRALLDASSSCP